MVDLLNADPRFYATITKSHSNTDRPKPAGLRYRVHQGVGRDGHKVEVWRKKDERYPGNVILSHDTSETYRTNRELAQKVLRLLTDGPPDRRKKGIAWNL